MIACVLIMFAVVVPLAWFEDKAISDKLRWIYSIPPGEEREAELKKFLGERDYNRVKGYEE